MSGVFLVDFPLLVQRSRPENEERGESRGGVRETVYPGITWLLYSNNNNNK